MSDISLNLEQKKAVEHTEGPLLIVAGAGTGKTTVITERIRWLISQQGIRSQSILALTFTEKAAQEMLARVDEIMPLGYEEPWLSTFHSFADRILREEALEIGLDPAYKIMTRADQWMFLRQHLFDLDLDYYRPLGNPTKFISALLTLFSRAQDECVGPGEFLALGRLDDDSQKWLEVAQAYKKYQQLKIEESRLDFGDLILWALRLFRERPNVLCKYQRQFQHILVDEFQDTNYAQYQLVKLLAPSKSNPNLVVVGDDDQSIYKFRGASVSNILEFKDDYPEARTVVLDQNYRSVQVLLDAAYNLIQNNNPDRLEEKLKIGKRLVSGTSRGGEKGPICEGKDRTSHHPQLLVAETAEREAAQVTEIIVGLLEDGLAPSSFAILARANNHLDPFVAALRRAGVPYQLVSNRGLFNQEEIVYLISLLRVIADPEDSVSLYHLLRHQEQRSDSTPHIPTLLQRARKARKPLWEMLPEGNHLRRAIEEAQRAAVRQPVTRVLYDLLLHLGFIEHYLEEESIENELKIKNINLFFEKVKRFESEAENPSVFEFVNYLDLLLEAGEDPGQAEIEDIDTVKLMTVHAAKGLEFPVVFLVNLISSRFPTRRRGDPIPLPDELVKGSLPEGDSHLQEERRLFYVGCTRAKEQLFLSYAENYGGKRKCHPSGFVGELGLLGADTPPSRAAFSELDRVVKVAPAAPRPLPTSQTFSYSQLETFRQCPLKYKYRYQLKIPGAPSHVLNFGQTIHRVLRDFHRAEQLQRKLELSELLRLYEKHWIGEGYDSREHREQRFAAGKDVLTRYFETYTQHFGWPLFLEKKFKLEVGGRVLVGSIDRIDGLGRDRKGPTSLIGQGRTLGRGQISAYEIIDYKTGSAKKGQQVDKDKQLTIYALAAAQEFKRLPEQLSLFFIEENEKFTTTRSDEDLRQAQGELMQTMEQIQSSDFPPQPGFLCPYCEYQPICPYSSNLKT